MGGLCPNQNIKVLPQPAIQEVTTIDPQLEIDTLINQETNYELSLCHKFSLEKSTLQTCDEVILEILSMSLSFMIKDFSEQSNFLKMQIQKQVSDLKNNTIEFQEDLLKMLIDYYDFVSYFQGKGARKSYLGGKFLLVQLKQNKQQNIGLKNLLSMAVNWEEKNFQKTQLLPQTARTLYQNQRVDQKTIRWLRSLNKVSKGKEGFEES